MASLALIPPIFRPGAPSLSMEEPNASQSMRWCPALAGGVYIYSTLLSLRAATFVLRVKQKLVTRIKGHRGGKAAITWQHECEHCELTVQAARCDRRYLLSGMTRASRWSHVISKSSGLYVVACHFEEPSFTMRPGVRHKGHGKVMLPTRLAAAIWTARHDSQIVPHP